MIDEEVIGFQISVDDASAVQVFQAQDHFGHILFGPFFGKVAQALDQGGTVAAIQVFHNQIEVVQSPDPVKVYRDHSPKGSYVMPYS